MIDRRHLDDYHHRLHSGFGIQSARFYFRVGCIPSGTITLRVQNLALGLKLIRPLTLVQTLEKRHKMKRHGNPKRGRLKLILELIEANGQDKIYTAASIA